VVRRQETGGDGLGGKRKGLGEKQSKESGGTNWGVGRGRGKGEK